jgi:hypothetical protein
MADLMEQRTHILHTVGDLSPALAHLNRQYRDTLAASLFHDAPMPLLVTYQWGGINEGVVF